MTAMGKGNKKKKGPLAYSPLKCNPKYPRRVKEANNKANNDRLNTAYHMKPPL